MVQLPSRLSALRERWGPLLQDVLIQLVNHGSCCCINSAHNGFCLQAFIAVVVLLFEERCDTELYPRSVRGCDCHEGGFGEDFRSSLASAVYTPSFVM